MRLRWLELDGFRSYPSLRFEPGGDVNVLVGRNAVGKTNLLEAIGYLGRLKSFRRVADVSLIAEDRDGAVLRAEVERPDGSSLVELELHRERRRRVQVNGSRLNRSADVADHLRVVVFQPDDLDIIKRSPSYRREFIDEAAAQLWPIAHRDQGDFERAVRQRNSLLRQMGRSTDRRTLEVWNERVAKAGAVVMARRAAAIDALRDPTAAAYRALVGEEVDVRIDYRSTWGSRLGDIGGVGEWEARLWEALERSSAEDMDRRVTTVGPQRDDPALLLGGRDTRVAASQGEQRSLVLSLRLAQQTAITDRLGHPPLMLLDDVFSELDLERAKALAGALPEGQTFISTARDEEVPVEGRRWVVRPGAVT